MTTEETNETEAAITGSIRDNVGVSESPSQEAPKLSNREALQQAISEKREAPDAPHEPREAQPTTKAEVKAAIQERPEPPSEFSAAGKKAWADGDIVGVQKEYRRVHDARTQEITRAQQSEQQARREAKVWKDLGDKAAPYIAARGREGVSPDQAIMEALALIDSFKGANPATVRAELKKVGIDLDAAPGAAPGIDPKAVLETPEIKALLTSHSALLEKEKARETEAVRSIFSDSIGKLAALKTRTGEHAFPGFHDTSEAGMQFAQELGSLTQEPLFQQLVLRRFPNATHADLVREAYIQLGGKVSGEPVKVSPEATQKHIEKSRRAAASTPGRVVVRNESANLVGKLSNRAALARALEESREH